MIENQIQVTTRWIEELALQEINMEESGVVQFDDHLEPIHFLEESSIELMDLIREKFEIYITKFNEYRGSTSGTQIKLFKISNTVNDFMIYRNSLRLVCARRANDVISVGFLSNSGGVYSARLSRELPAMNMAHEIKAHIGPFNQLTWRFNGEEIDLDALVKHYLTEFIKLSAR